MTFFVPTELISSAAGGRPSALDDLLEETRPQILALVGDWTGDWDEAEDLTQRVMLKVAANIPRLRDPTAFPGWLYRIAQNEAHTARRKAYTEVDVRTRWCRDRSPVPSSPDPGVDLDRRRARTLVAEAIGQLPRGQREACRLAYVGGLRPVEVAEALGRPRGTVRASLCHGRRELRRRLTTAPSPVLDELLWGESSREKQRACGPVDYIAREA